MSSETGRRFSLDKIQIDPRLKNRIMSADGDDELGSWDGQNIEDLVKELDRIDERYDPNYAGLPHGDNIPEDLRTEVAKDLPIWACDASGSCLVGGQADKIRDVNQIRKRYEKKYGGIGNFKEKLKLEREKFIKGLEGK
jgi:hypothetical protein